MACRLDELRDALRGKSASEAGAEEIEARARHACGVLAQAFLRPKDVRPRDRRDLREGLLDHRDRTWATRASPRSDRRFSRPPSVNPATPPDFPATRFHHHPT